MNFWDFFWLLIWSYFVFAYLMLIFQVFGDLFRDPELGGWSKALWPHRADRLPVPRSAGLPGLSRSGHGRTSAGSDQAGSR